MLSASSKLTKTVKAITFILRPLSSVNLIIGFQKIFCLRDYNLNLFFNVTLHRATKIEIVTITMISKSKKMIKINRVGPMCSKKLELPNLSLPALSSF